MINITDNFNEDKEETLKAGHIYRRCGVCARYYMAAYMVGCMPICSSYIRQLIDLSNGIIYEIEELEGANLVDVSNKVSFSIPVEYLPENDKTFDYIWPKDYRVGDTYLTTDSNEIILVCESSYNKEDFDTEGNNVKYLLYIKNGRLVSFYNKIVKNFAKACDLNMTISE